MNKNQVLARLSKLDPARSYMAQTETWHPKSDPDPTIYSIFILPGFDGTTCQLFRGSSFRSCLAQLTYTFSPVSCTEIHMVAID